MPCGVRCAETTRTSCATWNSPSASVAARMTGQSESLPMITPTSGTLASLTHALPEPSGGGHGARPYRFHVLTQHGHVPDLAARPHLLAVEVHLRPRVGGEEMVQPLVNFHGRSALGRRSS